jgi:hypothetical protein
MCRCRLATAADHAQTSEEFDLPWREEIAYWTGLSRVDGNISHEDGVLYEVLVGAEDTPNAWLHAGEAFSAAWLTAIEHSVSVLPLSAVVEIETTRSVLRRLLAQFGEPFPFLILRFGTSRLQAGQMVGVAGSTLQ